MHRGSVIIATIITLVTSPWALIIIHALHFHLLSFVLLSSFTESPFSSPSPSSPGASDNNLASPPPPAASQDPIDFLHDFLGMIVNGGGSGGSQDQGDGGEDEEDGCPENQVYDCSGVMCGSASAIGDGVCDNGASMNVGREGVEVDRIGLGWVGLG